MKNSLISLLSKSARVLVLVSFLGLAFGCEESVAPAKVNIEKQKNTEPDAPRIPK